MMARWCGFVLAVVVLGTAAGASADIRVWERGRDAETEEVSDPRAHRFLDLTAFAQPGVIFRFSDEFARGDNQVLLQRARLGMNAMLVWWLRMRIELEMAGSTPALQDAFLELRPHQAFNIAIGQMIVPFLHAYRFNELNLGFIDRPVYTPLAAAERPFLRYLSPRDVGVMVTGRIGDVTEGATSPVFEYAVGAFVGGRENITINNNDHWLYALRLKLHVLGVPEGNDAESDLARNERPRLAVAGGLYSNCDDRRNWNRGFTGDAELRWQGLYASAAFVWFKNGRAVNGRMGYDDCAPETDRNDPSRTLPFYKFVSLGAHFQVGYVLPHALFPIPNQALELQARFDWTNPNSPFDRGRPILGGGTDHPDYAPPSALNDSDNPASRYRLTFGLSYYPTGKQTLRLQINYAHVRELEDVVTPDGALQGVKNDMLWLQITAGL
ncbi:MAG: hypothetical protein KF901_27465 [Myxococcales bacterium]|nr:hypothetical protein [Myxococcales bacterium]